MRRLVCAASVVAALTLAAIFLLRPQPLPAEDVLAVPAQAAARPAAPNLPVTHVTLYSSGVGYFQREAEVDGDARIDLAFPVEDVNDLLKSMVLQDLGGGTVTAASCDSHNPFDRTLGSFAVNLNGNPSFAELLHQARGEKVEVLLRQAKDPLIGTVIGVEPGLKDLVTGQGQRWGQPQVPPVACAAPPAATVRYYQPAGTTKEEALLNEPARLNLLCPEGLRSVPLTEVQRVRFLNAAMEREFRRALEVLAGAHDTQKRTVSLSFKGEGRRKVRVGYVVESPLWRTSYRLLVGGDGKLLLQGWALVENPTGEDWKDVRLALVSGRPISFKMDLYKPLYLPRPTVQPQLFAGLQPTTHGDPLGVPVPTTAPLPGSAPAPAAGNAPIQGVNSFSNGDNGRFASTPVKQLAGGGIAGITFNTQYPFLNNLGRSVVSAATAAELGDFFEYAIKHPVSLPRQKSAMLPIVSKAVEGSRVSLYNESTHAKFPLLALKVKNTSGLHLMQGPVTIFEGSGYAGDAHLLDLRTGEDRLISYAIDLGTEVEPLSVPCAAAVTSVRIHKSILSTTTKARESKTYNIRNRSGHNRTVLIEHPFRPEFRLTGKAKPAERTRAVYRFEVKVAPGKSAALEVVEERDVVGQVALCGCEEHLLRQLLRLAADSAAIRQALEKALELKGKVAATQGELSRRQGQLQAIGEDQGRLRANLKEMPQTAAAYKRYLEKFDRQETEIEKLQGQVRELQDIEARQRQEYEAYWGKVEVGPTPVEAREQVPAPAPPAPVVRGVAPDEGKAPPSRP